MNHKRQLLDNILKDTLDAQRYEHSVSVMYTAAALAMRYGADIERIMTAGLMHDCAKCIPNEEKLRLCREYGLFVSTVEEKNPELLHGKLGAWLLRHQYHIEDEQILSAITYHSTGRPEMTIFDKIIYIADYIEPLRKKSPYLPDIRALAFQDLDLCLCRILEATLEYLKNKSDMIDSLTEETFHYYTRR